MKIGFFSYKPFSKKLGATKNRIELAYALEQLGWETHLIGCEELGLNKHPEIEDYRFSLKEYLITHSERYDIILYEYDSLPFDRSLFSSKTILIARPALLFYHDIKYPVDLKTKIKSGIGKIRSLLGHQHPEIKRYQVIEKSLKTADIIQAQNSKDFRVLKRKFPSKKIILISNGIDENRFQNFQSTVRNFDKIDTNQKIGFVGTFDFRKGAIDFRYIVKKTVDKFPNCEFKLLGTRGMFQTEEKVLKFFPYKLRKNLEVVPEFQPDSLHSMLADCHLGVFPSYFEGFPFGALEMMCSGLPVVGYDAPGSCDLLSKDLLVKVGNKKEIVEKIIRLLSNPNLLKEKSTEAKHIASEYQWVNIAKKVDAVYKRELDKAPH